MEQPVVQNERIIHGHLCKKLAALCCKYESLIYQTLYMACVKFVT